MNTNVLAAESMARRGVLGKFQPAVYVDLRETL
jgi:hypothetical protein